MKVLRHTIFANGHVEYEAMDTDNPVADQGNRNQVLAIFEAGNGGITEVTITKSSGTVSTYTKVDEIMAHNQYRLPATACGYKWDDGWGSDHRCSKTSGHPTDWHRCPCDANTRNAP